jgi:hypothetical protein
VKAELKSGLLLLVVMIATCCLTYSNSSPSISPYSPQYEDELQALNEFLKDFDDGFYGYFEVKDGFIYLQFKEGKFSKFKLKDMAEPEVDRTYGQLNWDCKNDAYCVTTDWNEEGKETGILFSDPGSVSLDYLLELLTNFINAYSGK